MSKNVGINLNLSKARYTQYRVGALGDLLNIIVPLFQKNLLHSVRQADFEVAVTMLKMIDNKEHLTREGMDKLLELNGLINQRRRAKMANKFLDNEE